MAEQDAITEHPASQAAHRAAGGGRCPLCACSDLEGRSIIVDDGFIAQPMTCYVCGGVWTDYYRLAGYVRPAGTPEGDADWEQFLATEIVERPATGA